MRAAVALMAYGSPERLADVPAYYADIRGGRPIRAELLAELTERYRRLGVEEHNPLNAITEETRAVLERELGIGPDILEHLTDLHGRGIDDVLLCPVGFVADHLEIRWDLDTEAQERAAELGIRLARIEMPNADPSFVSVLAAIVRRAGA